MFAASVIGYEHYRQKPFRIHERVWGNKTIAKFSYRAPKKSNGVVIETSEVTGHRHAGNEMPGITTTAWQIDLAGRDMLYEMNCKIR